MHLKRWHWRRRRRPWGRDRQLVVLVLEPGHVFELLQGSRLRGNRARLKRGMKWIWQRIQTLALYLGPRIAGYAGGVPCKGTFWLAQKGGGGRYPKAPYNPQNPCNPRNPTQRGTWAWQMPGHGKLTGAQDF